MKRLTKLVLIVITIIGLFFVTTVKASAPEMTLLQQKQALEALSPQELVKYYADKYNVLKMENKILSTIKCESNFNEKAVNMKDLHKGSKGSHGIAQFAYPTIQHYGKQIGIENPDPYNKKEAIEVMVYMFSIGQQNQWTCARKV